MSDREKDLEIEVEYLQSCQSCVEDRLISRSHNSNTMLTIRTRFIWMFSPFHPKSSIGHSKATKKKKKKKKKNSHQQIMMQC